LGGAAPLQSAAIGGGITRKCIADKHFNAKICLRALVSLSFPVYGQGLIRARKAQRFWFVRI
jgi:hypothetical protein